MLQMAIFAVASVFVFGFVLCALLVSGTGALGVKRALVSEDPRS